MLHGSKAQGRYVLFPTGGKNWMIHRMDPARQGFQPLPSAIAPMLATAGSLPAATTGGPTRSSGMGSGPSPTSTAAGCALEQPNDKDFTAIVPRAARDRERLGARPAVLDGELVALGEDGRPSFGRLQQRLHRRAAPRSRGAPGRSRVSYVIFDVLHLDGQLAA